MVDRHLMDIPQSSTQACYRNENASTSGNPNALVLGNHETSTGIQEISINYTSSGEVYDRSTTIINLYFSTIMAECKGHSDWNKWKEAIVADLNSLKKRKVLTDVIPTHLIVLPV
jgi:hypothetical protein